VVFFNTCEVGRLSPSLTAVDGWANRWVRRCGCTAFLAPIWSVEDGRAARFSELVYSHLYAGHPLGESVLLARRTLRHEDAGDLAWLAYSLYGAPNARILFGDQRPDNAAAAPLPLAQTSSSLIGAPTPVHRLFEEAQSPHAVGREAHARLSPGPGRAHGRLARPLAGAAAVLAVGVALALAGPWRAGSGKGPATEAGRDAGQVAETGLGADQGNTLGREEAPSPAMGQRPAPSSGTSRVSPSSPPAPQFPYPAQDPESGKVGIIVLDRQTGRLDATLAGAIRATFSRLGSGLNPFVPSLGAEEAGRLVQGDFAGFPSDGRTPWGAQYLLLAAARRRSLPQPNPHLESQSLFLDAQFIEARSKSTVARSQETHTGMASSVDGALAQAVERCLKPITTTLTGGDSHADSQ
jgi:hypothetical protein